MWWNVENLFDHRNDPATDDDDFTPSGRLHWTSKKLTLKQIRIRHVLMAIHAHPDYGNYPDMLAFAETENRQVFAETLGFVDNAGYRTVYHESMDPRGIDIGIAYNPLRLKLLSSRAYRVHLEDKPTRDVIVAGFSADGHPFHILLNHWPSRSFDTGWTEPKRLSAAKTARHIIDSLLARNQNADIVIMGDFNDEPENRSIKQVLGSSFDASAVRKPNSRLIYNCWNDAGGSSGTYFYRNHWEKIDQVMLSNGMLDGKGLLVEKNCFRVFSFSRMMHGSGREPWPTYEKGKYRGGYSDHLPLLLKVSVED
jgi:endonuclease/exonuclease/phosphatase family metal-dependent hydrolase